MKGKYILILLLLIQFDLNGARDTIVINENFKDLYIGQFSSIQHSKIKSELPSDIGWKALNSTDFRIVADEYNWIKTTLKNNTKFDVKYYYYLHNIQTEEARIVVMTNGVVTYNSMLTGCLLPSEKRPNKERTMALPFEIKSNEVSEVYLYVYRKSFGLTISPHIVNPINGIDFKWTDYVFSMVIFCDFIFLIFGIAMFIYCRKKQIVLGEVTWFIIYIITANLYVISASGYGSLYLWGDFPIFERNSAYFFGTLSGATFLIFCKLALDLPNKLKRLSYWFDFVCLYYVLAAFSGFLLASDLGHHYRSNVVLIMASSYLFTMSCFVIVIALAVRKLFWEKDKLYVWFLIIFLFFSIYTLIVLGLEVGLLSYNFKFHTVLVAAFYFPQMAVSSAFLLDKLIRQISYGQAEITNTRKEITHNIHDDIGTGLTRISLHSHMLSNQNSLSSTHKNQINKIKEEAVLANENVRDLLFAISPMNDNFHTLQVYMREMALSMIKNKEITFDFELQNKNSDFNLNLDLKTNLISIYKSIIKAILACEKCSFLKLFVDISVNKEITVTISYDGITFFDENGKMSGSIRNLEERLKKTGGRIEVIKNFENEVVLLKGNLSKQYLS